MSNLDAANPELNATVSASAGSGKTWLLVTRIVRLLLAGNEPGNILALTFTRKAAAEMHIRLHERLYEMATLEQDELCALLEMIEAGTDAATIDTARELYERLLYADYPIRLQTFHSFCQDILARFTLEADIPPGFELTEDTSLIQQQAWEKLFTEATRTPDSDLSKHLEYLMQRCNGPFNTRTALVSMLDHRSDWWAYTERQADPVGYATTALLTQLDITPGSDAYISAFFEQHTALLYEFCALLDKHPNAGNTAAIQTIHAAIDVPVDVDNPAENKLSILAPAFLTKAGTIKSRKHSKVMVKNMGEAGAERFVELHHLISEQLLHTLDIQKRHHCYALNTAWYYVGDRLLSYFQQLKRELRQLDFTDLEWKCYRLLSGADNAQWVQYKVDQRIDHILIDEFQDTNPTQWQLLFPVLDEMASYCNKSSQDDSGQRARSVFLVGDEKQSIYSFRRANPALQGEVSDWLHDNLDARATPLDDSWRSSPAIMDFVNAVFTQTTLTDQMPGFSPHGTHLKELAGRISLLPEFESDELIDDNPAFRHPLHQAHILPQANGRIKEAECIAAQIKRLIDERLIHDHGDIMILMRNRTHVTVYEKVFREQDIPYISNQRGGLLDNLEICDLECLLDVLITPFDNLALAQVLKSPVFQASDEDLQRLAATPGESFWYQRLQQLAVELPAGHTLARAARQLDSWHRLADTIPVHDLLDHIYAETDLIARYRAAAPDEIKLQVCSNLNRFLEMSLDIDSGRYPGLSQFKHYLRSMRQHANDNLSPPDTDDSNSSRVRIMTIHASKGLESPVVFLADCNSGGNNKHAYHTLVDWPETEQRPAHLLLQTGQAGTDSMTLALQDKKQQLQQRENLNLLYVALTRAKQFLFISAQKKTRQDDAAWYTLLETAMQSLPHPQQGDDLVYQFGSFTPDGVTSTETASQPTTLPIGLLDRHIDIPAADYLIAPSRADSVSDDDASVTQDHTGTGEAQLRGILIHQALDLLSRKQGTSEQDCTRLLAETNDLSQADSLLQACIEEARRNIDHPDFEWLFKADEQQAYNEQEILFQAGDRQAYGIIDRMIVTQEKISIVDYKSHRLDDASPDEIAQNFAGQMRLYKTGVQTIWPDRDVVCAILFTENQRLVWLD